MACSTCIFNLAEFIVSSIFFGFHYCKRDEVRKCPEHNARSVLTMGWEPEKGLWSQNRKTLLEVFTRRHLQQMYHPSSQAWTMQNQTNTHPEEQLSPRQWLNDINNSNVPIIILLSFWKSLANFSKMIILQSPPKCWDYSWMPPHQILEVLNMLCMKRNTLMKCKVQDSQCSWQEGWANIVDI